MTTIKVHSPYDGSLVAERALASPDELEAALNRSVDAFKTYGVTPLEERMAITSRFLDELDVRKDQLARELCVQLGRPLAGCKGEVATAIVRGRYLVSIAKAQLGDIDLSPSNPTGQHRYIQRVPLGPILIISPWNYPYLCQVNGVVAALLAGNTVLLKPSPFTPLAGEAFSSAYLAAGLPEGVLQTLHLSPELSQRAVADKRTMHVVFTGSVNTGRLVAAAAATSATFKGVTLELGGKDPVYLREDAKLEHAVPDVVDGAFYNSGQSCCAVERIYVHKSIADEFTKRFVDAVKEYKLGDPLDPSTTLGPVISPEAAAKINAHVESAGATAEIAPTHWNTFSAAFVHPQVLTNCTQKMDFMRSETFGPVIGIITVDSDEQAIAYMNDSAYGLTAGIYTQDEAAFARLAPQVQSGTVFMNACDSPDPALPWSGIKDSGKGISMSQFAFDAFVQTKGVKIRRV